jgi:enoyl-CoA hydratase/carnithine racemase
MLRQVAQKHGRRVLSRQASSSAAREYTYYDNFEVKDGVALLRLNGPGKMNIIHEPLLLETQKIFKEKIETNKDIKAVVFISSKPDNFIAGADIESIKKIGPNSDKLTEVSAKGQQLLADMKKVK